MQITYLYKDLKKEEEAFVNEYFEKKLERIRPLLVKFSDDAALLNVKTTHFDKHSAYEVELCLKLPSKSLVSKEVSHEINKSIDLSTDRIVSQIKKHMDHLRKDRSHASIRNSEKMSELKGESKLV